MLIDELPERFNPVRLCLAGKTYQVTKLPGRINQDPVVQFGDLRVKLDFGIDKEGYSVVSGQLAITVNATCERCLQPISTEIVHELQVSPVASEAESEKLPEHYEPLFMENNEVKLSDWIAEEIYLALPLVLKHDPECEHELMVNKD